MSPKGPHGWILSLLLLVTVACLVQHCEGSAYQGFLKRHLDNPKSDFGNSNNYCYQMMRRKGLRCQRGNTFIHTSEALLKSLVCTSRGRVLQGNVTSKTMFPLTICKIKRRLRKLWCRYKGKTAIKRIRVTCDKGLPVHFISHV
ncbi:ribonuclease-like [Sphaerodactylus townsendi]|uniref:ribonuclease-like n=1 Tax=Sphaerodactylus townsendi TaxID=933632 RepID=UPI002025F0B9|nr:ribonuclease-like [Sphaerodactylus townsendi]